ncbi:MAG: acyclic terpene utilization AtuA family protein [Balneolaceae bacterium]|nr:acyclic terpene utilization AtuA family protein [Balneolaceae bacterium]
MPADIIECGAQATGGNFTDWQQIDDFIHIGFPIIEAYPDGNFIITKHEGTGGLVNEMTVKEQLVYEIADPKNYLTPDAIADFTSLHLEKEGPHRVRISGVSGRPPTDTYKVSASDDDGFERIAQHRLFLAASAPEIRKSGRNFERQGKCFGAGYRYVQL